MRQSKRHTTRARRERGQVEGLERRMLLSAGDLDSSFGGGDDQMNAMAVREDGKILAAGFRYGPHTSFGGAVIARYNPSGDLDRTFGPGGDEGYGAILDTRFATATAVTAAPGGKIVVAGRTPSDQRDLALARYNPDGTPDVTFGAGDGFVTTHVSDGGSGASDVAVLTGGKILLCGTSDFQSPSPATRTDLTLVRYNADGSLDPTFGEAGTGITTTDFGIPTDAGDAGMAMAVLPDGKVLVSGIGGGQLGVARYSAGGLLDKSFGGGDGLVRVYFADGGTGSGIAVSPGGVFYVAGGAGVGWNDPKVALVAFEPDGAVRWTVTTPVGSRAVANAIDLAPTGELVVAGWTTATAGSGHDVLLARYLPDGRLDATFGGGDGILTTDLGTPYDDAVAVDVLAGGRILVGGSRSSAYYSGNDFALARYLGDPVQARPLVVDGTSGNDVVSVRRSADGLSLDITVNGATTRRPLESVSTIVLNGRAGDDRLEVADSITLPATLDGGPGNDRLLGGGGRDTLLGDDGNDVMDGRKGGDVFRGGAGTDTADYTARRNSVKVGIGTAADDGEKGEGDNVLTDVENVWGGSGNDEIRGSDAGNRLAGGAGDDVIYGHGGRDTLLGGDGNDQLFARDAGADTVDGGAGTDRADVDRVDTVTGVEERTPAGKFFSTDFSIPRLHPALQDPDSAYAIADGVIRQTRTGTESEVRRYIRTVRPDYFDDFVFQVTYTPASITFIGVGAGEPTAPFAEPARDSLYLRLHAPDVSAGHVDVSFDDPFNVVASDIGRITTPGPHRARITRTGDLVRFEVDVQPTGAFVPEVSATVDLRRHPEIRAALARESRLFFGTGERTAPFDNVSVTPAAVP